MGHAETAVRRAVRLCSALISHVQLDREVLNGVAIERKLAAAFFSFKDQQKIIIRPRLDTDDLSSRPLELWELGPSTTLYST